MLPKSHWYFNERFDVVSILVFVARWLVPVYIHFYSPFSSFIWQCIYHISYLCIYGQFSWHIYACFLVRPTHLCFSTRWFHWCRCFSFKVSSINVSQNLDLNLFLVKDLTNWVLFTSDHFLPHPEYCDIIYGWPLRFKSFVWKISLTLLAIFLSITFPATSEPQLIFILLSKGKEYNR